MKDGLYRVDWGSVCFGFVLKNNICIKAAPIYWKQNVNWHRIAVWVCEL